MGEARRLAQEYYDRFGSGDVDGAAELFSPDCITQLPVGDLTVEQHRQFGHAFKAALPDSGMTVVSVVEDGDCVAIQGRFSGTHTATLRTPQGDIPARGTRIDFPYGDFFRVADGRIVEHAVYWDNGALLVQLGMPAGAGVRALVEEAVALFETDRLDRLGEIAHPDLTYVQPGVTVEGVDEVRAFWESYRRALPDVRHDLVATVESGDAIAVRMRITGTHTGPLAVPGGELPPTGRTVDFESISWITARDGRLATWQSSFDPAVLATQLGVAGQPAGAGAAR